MQIKTNELTGAALDWAVAKCEGQDPLQYETAEGAWHTGNWLPSTDWSQGGPIIEREGIELFRNKERDQWYGTQYGGAKSYGPTPLIAAMRCYVASKLGDEIDVPGELV